MEVTWERHHQARHEDKTQSLAVKRRNRDVGDSGEGVAGDGAPESGAAGRNSEVEVQLEDIVRDDSSKDVPQAWYSVSPTSLCLQLEGVEDE